MWNGREKVMKLVNVRWVDGACHATLAVALRRAIEVDRVRVGDIYGEILGCVEARVEAIGGWIAGGSEIALDHIVCWCKTKSHPIQKNNRGIELAACLIILVSTSQESWEECASNEKSDILVTSIRSDHIGRKAETAGANLHIDDRS